jgi:hypothetical protein
MMDSDVIRMKYHAFVEGQGCGFDELALEVFHHQRLNNPVYSSFLSYLSRDYSVVNDLTEIPFMPVGFFKNNVVKTGNWVEEIIFESSSTTGSVPSKNHIRNLGIYRSNSEFCFNEKYGRVGDHCFFALLPSYLEKGNSSLVFMIDHFIKLSGCGRFYRDDFAQLYTDLNAYCGIKKPVLFGVTYALLDFAREFKPDKDVLIMETGGMKGRGPELPRERVHDLLCQAFKKQDIHSEYGMTELMSQAYSSGDGIFSEPQTMKILISDLYDPFSTVETGIRGRINVIDLSNFDTCSFLATDDLGMKVGDNKFKVLGRTDESDIRGCNLLYV